MASPSAVQNSFSQTIASSLILNAPLSDDSIVRELAQRILKEDLPRENTEIDFKRGSNQICAKFSANGTLEYLYEKTFFSERTMGSEQSFAADRKYEWLSDRSSLLGTVGDAAALGVTTIAGLTLAMLIQQEIKGSLLRGTVTAIGAALLGPAAVNAVGRAVKSLVEGAPVLVGGAVAAAGAVYLCSDI